MSYLQASQYPKHLSKYDPVAKTDYLVIEVVPQEKLSVSCEKDNDPNKDLWSRSTSSNAVGQLSESSSGEPGAAGCLQHDSADKATECVYTDSEEEEWSVYDCPHTLQVDLGDGEMATGYKG